VKVSNVRIDGLKVVVLVFYNEDVVLAAHAQLQPALYQLLLADLAQSICITCATVSLLLA
jgi:hypothetical protein